MTARLDLRLLSTADAGFDAAFEAVRCWSGATDAGIEERTAAIVADVRARGDAAVLEHSRRLDGISAASMAELEVPAAELEAALAAITPAQRNALDTAATRIRRFHERQRDATARGFSFVDEHGSRLGQKVTPLDRVGIYVPGGKAAYPSSVLMSALPAAVAGVGEIVMVSPTPSGQRNALVLAAARLAGVHRVFAIGGAQAVAALAYGTASVPKVDKITGPGNAYVAAAKRRVFGEVGIDMIAGPSEILVLADGSTPADWVAMDLFSQAEHDELAQSLLLCPDAGYIAAVRAAIERLLPQMPRRDVIRASLEGRGALILTRSMEEACAIANRVAPEHLEICAAEPRRWEPLLRHAGAIFLGAFTSESLGDYCAGPNHVLPTAGTARFSSPLGVHDFVKRTSLLEVSAAGAAALGVVAAELAHGEGLTAHARAAEMRAEAPHAPLPTVQASSDGGLSVQPVDRQNLPAVLKLAVAPDQVGFVSPVATSIAQASFEPEARSLVLLHGDETVGHLLLLDVRRHADKPANQLYVWRLFIDARFQRRGFGAAAVRWVIAEARRLGVAAVGLSHVEANAGAGLFYEGLGFRYTGEVEGVERKMLLPVSSQPAGA